MLALGLGLFIWAWYRVGSLGSMLESPGPAPGTESIPSLTEPLIAKTPVIGLGVMGSLLGINWVIRRRMKLARDGTGPHDGEGSPPDTEEVGP